MNYTKEDYKNYFRCRLKTTVETINDTTNEVKASVISNKYYYLQVLAVFETAIEVTYLVDSKCLIDENNNVVKFEYENPSYTIRGFLIEIDNSKDFIVGEYYYYMFDCNEL